MLPPDWHERMVGHGPAVLIGSLSSARIFDRLVLEFGRAVTEPATGRLAGADIEARTATGGER